MSLIPQEELKKQGSINFAPLVDFLFLVLAVFATLAVTRTALYDTDLKLVKTHTQKTQTLDPQQEVYIINLSITQSGAYKWITETSEFFLDGAVAVAQELKRQQEVGLLPKQGDHIKVLLHIDKGASWEMIAPLVLSVKEAGFVVHPVYEKV